MSDGPLHMQKLQYSTQYILKPQYTCCMYTYYCMYVCMYIYQVVVQTVNQSTWETACLHNWCTVSSFIITPAGYQ